MRIVPLHLVGFHMHQGIINEDETGRVWEVGEERLGLHTPAIIIFFFPFFFFSFRDTLS